MVATSGFFFSSRRRHTRSKRDWSSDVCSSDLKGRGTHRKPAWRGYKPGRKYLENTVKAIEPDFDTMTAHALERMLRRSEERRVGKECRGGWARGANKAKNTTATTSE